MDAEQEIWIYQQISHRASTAGIVNSAHGSKNRLASSSIQGLAGASHTPRKSLTFTRRDSMHLPHGRSHSQELHDGKMQIKLLPALLNGNTGSGSSDGTVYSSSTMGHLVSEQIFNTCRFTAKQLKDMEALLSTIEQWNFDIFALSEITNGWTLTVLGYFLFKRCGLIESLNLPVDKFSRFLMRLERGYHDDLPYHNSIHAADVLHAIHYFTQLDTIHKVLSDLDIFAMFFAAMVHDHDHPGVVSSKDSFHSSLNPTNQFLIIPLRTTTSSSTPVPNAPLSTTIVPYSKTIIYPHHSLYSPATKPTSYPTFHPKTTNHSVDKS